MGRFMSALADKLNLFGGWAILLMAAIMATDVVCRYLLKQSFFDAVEMSSLLLGAVVSLSLSFVTEKEEHITFDLVTTRLPIRVGRVAKGITLTISMGIFVLLTWQTFIRSVASFKEGQFYGTMQIPLWPIKFLFSLACLSTLLILVYQFFALFTRREEC